MLIIFTQPSWAEDKTCTTSGCIYQVSLDRTGFYIAVVTLPSGQPEGVWSLLMNPGRLQPYYGGGFFGGGTLKEHSQFGSWIGFSLAEGERVRIKPTNYTDNQAPLQMRLEKEISDSGRVLVEDWALRTPGQTFTTQTLDPGFYVISVLSQPNALNNTFFGLDLGAPSIYGGVVGGWLDSQPGSMGYGAFYLDSPRTMDFQLMFDGDYGMGGAGQPYLEIYYQKEDGTREVYWSAPKQDSVGEVIEPTIPVVLPEPAVLPPDPGEAGKTTLEGIDSDKDGVRDDVQRYIALTYPNPEDKPFRAALREYSAFQRVFITEADDTWKTIANAENRAKQIDCVLYLHAEDGQAGLVNLRAEYLNTELRTRTYLTADGQLGGHPISLTPLEDLPQLCQKFTTRSSAMIRSSRQSASCKKDTGTVINLSNGAMTDAESAQRELTMLRTHVESAKASSAISGEKLSYVATYNSTKSWINRLLNWVLPKLDEDSPKSTSKFWRWLGNTEQPPQTFIDVSLDTANDPAFVVPQELQSHVGTYRTFIDEGRKVVAVAHAEGNLYVNQAYESLDEEIDLRARKNSFGAVSIASSVRVGGSSCAMAVAGSAVAMAGGGCTNLQTDAVIGATSTADSSVSIANSVVHTLPGFVQDPLDHSFLSYLEGDISGPKIVNDVITAIPKLTPSPIVSQGVITVRLEWGEQPDVDLHVYEPSGSHVYFVDDRGVSGYLDLDDKDGEGPEHYYAKCETLQPGIYKIAVDYFSGTGPETARINISAGEIIRSYTVPLASADTGAGPIPVAIIKVTQDEQSGEFKFEILSQKTPDQGTTSSKPSSSENSQPSVSENPQPSTSEKPQQPSTSGENQPSTSEGSQPTTPVEPVTGQQIPTFITTRITDPRTDLGFIIANSNGKELTTIHGEKDSEGNLKSVTDLTYVVKDTSSQNATPQSVNLKFENGTTEPKLTMRFPAKDGKKKEVKVENYDHDKKTADLTFVERDENGNETEIAKLEQQSVELPKDSCYDNPFAVSFTGGSVHDQNRCGWKWAHNMINTFMGKACEVIPGIIKLSDWISQVSTGQASICEPYKNDVPPNENSPGCDMKPITDITDAASGLEAILNIKKGNWEDIGMMIYDDILPSLLDDFFGKEQKCEEDKSTGILPTAAHGIPDNTSTMSHNIPDNTNTMQHGIPDNTQTMSLTVKDRCYRGPTGSHGNYVTIKENDVEREVQDGEWINGNNDGSFSVTTYSKGTRNGHSGSWTASCKPTGWHNNYVNDKLEGVTFHVWGDGTFRTTTYHDNLRQGPEGHWNADGTARGCHGNYVDDKLEGMQYCYDNKGKPYGWSHNYTNGKLEGVTFHVWGDGTFRTTTYHDNLRQGPEGHWNADGTARGCHGNYVDDKLEGMQYCYDNKGKPSGWSHNYTNGKLEGVTFHVWSDGSFRSTTYVDGIRQGPEGHWNADGTARGCHGNYVDDKRDGMWYCYDNKGKPSGPSGKYTKGKQDDMWIYVQSNGAFQKTFYVNDIRQGPHSVWNADGTASGCHGDYANGKQVGAWICYKSDGTTYTETYVDGVKQ
jgi:antitoxin component YwqK of YwqJK toxin-antitoxin module